MQTKGEQQVRAPPQGAEVAVPLDFSYFRLVCQAEPTRCANVGLLFLVVCILVLRVEDCHASMNPFDLSIAHAG